MQVHSVAEGAVRVLHPYLHLSFLRIAWDLNLWASSCNSPFVVCCAAGRRTSLSLSLFLSAAIYFPSLGQTDGSVLE